MNYRTYSPSVRYPQSYACRSSHSSDGARAASSQLSASTHAVIAGSDVRMFCQFLVMYEIHERPCGCGYSDHDLSCNDSPSSDDVYDPASLSVLKEKMTTPNLDLMMQEICQLVNNDFCFEMECKLIPVETEQGSESKTYTQGEARQMAYLLGRVYSISHCLTCTSCRTKYLIKSL